MGVNVTLSVPTVRFISSLLCFSSAADGKVLTMLLQADRKTSVRHSLSDSAEPQAFPIRCGRDLPRLFFR